MEISAKCAALLLLVCSCSALQDCPLQTDFELAVCVPALQCEIYLSLELYTGCLVHSCPGEPGLRGDRGGDGDAGGLGGVSEGGYAAGGIPTLTHLRKCRHHSPDGCY